VKLVSFGGVFFILPGERGVVAKEGLWMVDQEAQVTQKSLLVLLADTLGDSYSLPILPNQKPALHSIYFKQLLSIPV
jgi:hypothetical protein